MLAAVDWARERELDRTPLRLQDLADHYAASEKGYRQTCGDHMRHHSASDQS